MFQNLALLSDAEIAMLRMLFDKHNDIDLMAALYDHRAAIFPSTQVPDGLTDAFDYKGIIALGAKSWRDTIDGN